MKKISLKLFVLFLLFFVGNHTSAQGVLDKAKKKLEEKAKAAMEKVLTTPTATNTKTPATTNNNTQNQAVKNPVIQNHEENIQIKPESIPSISLIDFNNGKTNINQVIKNDKNYIIVLWSPAVQASKELLNSWKDYYTTWTNNLNLEVIAISDGENEYRIKKNKEMIDYKEWKYSFFFTEDWQYTSKAFISDNGIPQTYICQDGKIIKSYLGFGGSNGVERDITLFDTELRKLLNTNTSQTVNKGNYTTMLLEKQDVIIHLKNNETLVKIEFKNIGENPLVFSFSKPKVYFKNFEGSLALASIGSKEPIMPNGKGYIGMSYLPEEIRRNMKEGINKYEVLIWTNENNNVTDLDAEPSHKVTFTFEDN